MKNIIRILERWLYKNRINSIFQYLVFVMAGVYVLMLSPASANILSKLMITRSGILNFELWRIFTFIFIPPITSILNALLFFYFTYYIGTSLEKKWGVAKFLIFYLIGVISIIVASLVVGIGVNTYLNLSLLFAFSLSFPEQQINLFLVIPIKMKWLGAANALYYLFMIIFGSNIERINILFSLINVFLFFGGDIVNITRSAIYQYKRKKSFKDSFKR